MESNSHTNAPEDRPGGGITPDEIRRRLTNQPPRSEHAGEVLDALTEFADAFGRALVGLVPAGREQLLAVTKLEEALFWGKKGVALNQDRLG